MQILIWRYVTAASWSAPSASRCYIPGRVWTAKIKFKLLFHWGAPPPRPPVIVGLEASVIDWEGHLPQQQKVKTFDLQQKQKILEMFHLIQGCRRLYQNKHLLEMFILIQPKP